MGGLEVRVVAVAREVAEGLVQPRVADPQVTREKRGAGRRGHGRRPEFMPEIGRGERLRVRVAEGDLVVHRLPAQADLRHVRFSVVAVVLGAAREGQVKGVKPGLVPGRAGDRDAHLGIEGVDGPAFGEGVEEHAARAPVMIGGGGAEVVRILVGCAGKAFLARGAADGEGEGPGRQLEGRAHDLA